MSTNKTPLQRFEEKIDKSGECWIWTASRNQKGYGLFQADYKRFIASRFAYEVWIGQIPEGMLVCHKCDNPPCVNPDHLFVGTAHDNAMDMVNKGRQNYGHRYKTKTHCANGHELTPDNVRYHYPSRRGKRPKRVCNICYKNWTKTDTKRRAEKRKTEQ